MGKSAISKIKSTIILFLFVPLSTMAQKGNMAYQAYIDQYKDLAIEQMLRYNIPASITLAQGLLESGAGNSELARNSNNHFGIKCHGWTGRKSYHDDDEANECFRVYNNVKESYEDHSRFLATQSRYARLFTMPRTDYKGWATGLKACGYATSPQYASNLIQIIERYSLYKYDRATSYDKFMADHFSTDKRASDGSLHQIKAYNKNYYLIAKTGDTFKSLSKEVGISSRKLAKYNERNRKDVLSQGDIIYLKKKRTKAEKKYKHNPHTVRSGESMYTIAQLYGVRLKSLYEKNNLTPSYEIKVGDKIRVY
jgi:LysM repeat protein